MFYPMFHFYNSCSDQGLGHSKASSPECQTNLSPRRKWPLSAAFLDVVVAGSQNGNNAARTRTGTTPVLRWVIESVNTGTGAVA